MNYHDKRTPKILGISSGNGVMLYPFKEYLIGNIECRSDYLSKGQSLQWQANFDGIPYSRTLLDIDIPVDVIIGHPKCGSSSVFALSRGKKFTSHVGEPSLELYIQAVNKYRPKLFFLENLPRLLETMPEKELKAQMKGYSFMYWTGSVSEFGNSQVSRKRMLVIGLRNDYNTERRRKTLSRIHVPIEPRNTETLLQNLPSNGHWTEDIEEVITMYAGFKIRLDDAKDYWNRKPELRHWPCKPGSNMGTAPGVYINRAKDLPLTVRKTNRQFNPEGIQMTPRELARIQGVPDKFLFAKMETEKASINKGRITVANTPPMEIAYWIYDRLKMLKIT